MKTLARRVCISAAALAALLVVGCLPGPTFVVQQYGGPPRPRGTIAVLRVNGKEPTRLLVLDDQDVAAPIVEDGRLHIEVLPGSHTVVAANASAPKTRYSPMTFDAAPGRVYRVTFPAGPTGEARVYEVGRQDDMLIRDVTKDITKTEDASPHPRSAADASAPEGDAGAPSEPAAGADAG
ncbi:MAG TPA: hypothetical protein VM925_36950 [Labilithrix sp.]|nr:hypothetical protein [Labilithrix sp.]